MPMTSLEVLVLINSLARQSLAKALRLLGVAAAHGEVAQSLQRHLLGMRRTADAGQVLVGHVVHLMEIFRANEVFVGHDTFDGCDDELVADVGS